MIYGGQNHANGICGLKSHNHDIWGVIIIQLKPDKPKSHNQNQNYN